ncbi:MAG: MotA/TolQ/ExbB proton channel family protein [Solirubrobacteraceae bacterium]
MIAAPLAEIEFVTDALSGVAEALEVPVHVMALLLLLVLALELGRGLTETWRRVRPGHLPLVEVGRRAFADPKQAAQLSRLAPSRLAERAVFGIGTAIGTGKAEDIENSLADFELGVQRRLDRTRMLVRAGPALGLMGTLIPLAPGLAALGRGDIAQLADNMQTAFAATVVGLLVGTVAFALTLARTRVYTEDLAALERATSQATPGAPEHERLTETVAEPEPAT